MKTSNCFTSTCRYCRYYKSEGRRGGTCELLSAPVQAHWKACSLAVNPFIVSSWDQINLVRLENSLSLECAETNNDNVNQEEFLTTKESKPV